MTDNFNLIIQQQGGLREYADKSLLGDRLKKDLLTKYGSGKSGTEEGFYIGYREEYTGLLTQCYGAISLLLIQNAYGTKFTDKEKSLIIKIVEDVLNHVELYGFDLDPFIEEKKTTFFQDKNYRYTDALSWVLSLVTQTRYASRLGNLSITDDLNYKLAQTARNILEFFINTVVGGENNPQGWGYVNGCEEASIYFTYAATESFNDFEDYIMGNEEINTTSDTDFLELINSGIKAEENLPKRLSNINKKIGLNLWSKYKDLLHTEFLGDNGLTITKDQIRNSTRTSALFFNVYIVCTLIYCETDKQLTNEDERERMLTLSRQALQMVSSFYDILKSDGLDNIVDKHILSFDQSHPEKKALNKLFAGVSITTSSLTPLLIKANGLLTFYVTQFPEREMSRYLDMAIEKRIDAEHWLWEDIKFDLATTERYIEAILDFYDYYEKYEKEYLRTKIKTREKEQELRKSVTAKLRPELMQEIEKELSESHENEMNQLRQEITSSFKLEELINEKIEQAIQTQALDVFKKALNEITLLNRNDEKRNDPNGDTVELANIFQEAIKSYFYRFTYQARKFDFSAFESDTELVNSFSKDLSGFIQSWFSYLVKYKGNHGMRWIFDNVDDGEKYILKERKNRDF